MTENESNAASYTPVLMPPFFPGNMVGQKFRGKNSDVGLGEWEANLKVTFRMFNLASNVQADVAIQSLEGEAKRQVLILPETERDAFEKIVTVLKELYGDKMPASVLRSMCFSCRQELPETVQEFALRLQELFQKLRKRDPEGTPNSDRLLREQFIDGLTDRFLRRELRMLTLTTPTLSFSDINREARLRQEAEGEGATCFAIGRTAPSTAAPLDLQQLKKDLKEEMTAEIKSQMVSLTKELTKELVKELRAELAPGGGDHHDQARGPYERRHHSTSSFPAPQRHPLPVGRKPMMYQYDEEGRPICKQCQAVGHIQRYCPQRARSNSMGSQTLNY